MSTAQETFWIVVMILFLVGTLGAAIWLHDQNVKCAERGGVPIEGQCVERHRLGR